MQIKIRIGTKEPEYVNTDLPRHPRVGDTILFRNSEDIGLEGIVESYSPMDLTYRVNLSAKSRAALEHTYTKCACGNTAAYGENQCGACADNTDCEHGVAEYEFCTQCRIEEMEQRIEALEAMVVP